MLFAESYEKSRLITATKIEILVAPLQVVDFQEP